MVLLRLLGLRTPNFYPVEGLSDESLNPLSIDKDAFT